MHYIQYVKFLKIEHIYKHAYKCVYNKSYFTNDVILRSITT